MNYSNLGLMILSHDDNKFLWDIFLKQLLSYFPESKNLDIFFVTETQNLLENLKENYSIVSLHKDYQKPVKKWSGMFKDALIQFNKEFVLVLLDDFLLTEETKSETVFFCLEEMKMNTSIACFNFKYTKGEAKQNFYRDFELKSIEAPFRINLQAALWRVDFLKMFIRKHENPWQFENWGSRRAKRYKKDDIFTLKKTSSPVFHYQKGGILSDGRWNGDEAIKTVKNIDPNFNTKIRSIYYKGEPRKTEIRKRSLILKIIQVIRSLI